MDNELIALLALQSIPGAGPVAWRRILEVTGSAAAFMEHGFGEEIEKQLTPRQRQQYGTDARLNALHDAHCELDLAAREGVLVWGRHQAEYPQRLLQCADAPLVLFTRGAPAWSARKVIAVVGTRRCTERGIRWTERFVEQLPPGVVVVSGLARGIDAAAHRAALASDKTTWGVSAAGLSDVYPAQHRKLASDMIQHGGALITECRFEQQADAGAFPRRNRIVAGLVDAVVVVESHEKGGSLITASLARSYDREVFAVPGRTDDSAARGGLQLLVHHSAGLAVDAEQVCREMGWGGVQEQPPSVPVPKHLQPLFEWMAERSPVHTDELRQVQPVPDVAAKLLELECLGRVRSLPGAFYECV